jgi:hypothetical protein
LETKPESFSSQSERVLKANISSGQLMRNDGKFFGGGLYAPFVLDRYATPAGGEVPGRRATNYWVVS